MGGCDICFVWILSALVYCFRVSEIHVSDELVDVLESNLHAMDTSCNKKAFCPTGSPFVITQQAS